MPATSTKPDLHAIAREIASYLPGYAVVPPEDGQWYASLRRETDGAAFVLTHARGTKAQVHVSGKYPEDLNGNGRRYMSPRDWCVLPYGETEPSIGVSGNRSPEVIARDIARRFLPEYEPLYAACLVRKAERDSYRTTTRSQLEKVADALGEGARKISDDADADRFTYYGPSGIFGTFHATSLELRSLPPDAVVEIAAIVRRYGEGRTK